MTERHSNAKENFLLEKHTKETLTHIKFHGKKEKRNQTSPYALLSKKINHESSM